MKFSLSFEELLAEIDGEDSEGDWRGDIHGIATLSEAAEGDLSFLGNPRYASEVPDSSASVILLPGDYEGHPRRGQTFVRVSNPSLALGRVCASLERNFRPHPPAGIHPTAIIDRDAYVAESASIGPYCLVSAGARIGADVVLASHAAIGAHAVVGRGSRLHAHVTVGDYCEIGEEALLNPGVVIGADGFGYETTDGIHHKIPQIGTVVVGDRVEIGANTTVDRARFSETRIGEGTKIDNLVQIGHNVRIGEHCLIVAQVGISGSTTIKDHVVVGGQSGIVGHITIGSGSQIGGQSGVSKSLPAGSVVQGAPAVDIHLFQRINALQRRLPEFFARFREWEATTSQPDIPQ